jgi:hypothetical protein
MAKPKTSASAKDSENLSQGTGLQTSSKTKKNWRNIAKGDRKSNFSAKNSTPLQKFDATVASMLDSEYPWHLMKKVMSALFKAADNDGAYYEVTSDLIVDACEEMGLLDEFEDFFKTGIVPSVRNTIKDMVPIEQESAVAELTAEQKLLNKIAAAKQAGNKELVKQLTDEFLAL